MVELTRAMRCCGIAELSLDLYGASPSIRSFKSLYREIIDTSLDTSSWLGQASQYPTAETAIPPPYIIISEQHKYKSGREFVKMIKKFKLGEVVAAPVRLNANSGNKIQAWIWALDWPAYKRWYKAQTARKATRKPKGGSIAIPGTTPADYT